MTIVLAILSAAALVLYARDLVSRRAPEKLPAGFALGSIAVVVGLGIWFPIPLAVVSATSGASLFFLGRQILKPVRTPSTPERAYCLGCAAIPVLIWSAISIQTSIP